jgi:hypothetical protein
VNGKKESVFSLYTIVNFLSRSPTSDLIRVRRRVRAPGDSARPARGTTSLCRSPSVPEKASPQSLSSTSDLSGVRRRVRAPTSTSSYLTRERGLQQPSRDGPAGARADPCTLFGSGARNRGCRVRAPGDGARPARGAASRCRSPSFPKTRPLSHEVRPRN